MRGAESTRPACTATDYSRGDGLKWPSTGRMHKRLQYLAHFLELYSSLTPSATTYSVVCWVHCMQRSTVWPLSIHLVVPLETERVCECLPVLCVWPRRKQMVIWQLNFLASSGHSFSQSASQQHSLADCEWLYQTHNNNISILPRCPRQAATKKLHHTAIPAQILF